MGVRDGRWLSWIAGLALGAAVGVAVPFEASPTAQGPVALSASTRPVAQPAPPASPRSAAPVARAAPEDERAAHLEQRRAFLSAWGRPPLPASADQPDEAEVIALLEEVTDDPITLVDCFTYPCELWARWGPQRGGATWMGCAAGMQEDRPVARGTVES